MSTNSEDLLHKMVIIRHVFFYGLLDRCTTTREKREKERFFGEGLVVGWCRV